MEFACSARCLRGLFFFFFTQTIYPSISLSLSTFPLMNTTASQTDHYHSNLSRLESQQVELAPAGHAAVTKAPLALPNLPPAGNPLRRHMEATARRCANVDAIRFAKTSPGPQRNQPPPAPSTTHFLLLLITPSVPSIITMSPAPPVGKVYPRRALFFFSREGSTLSLSSRAL